MASIEQPNQPTRATLTTALMPPTKKTMAVADTLRKHKYAEMLEVARELRKIEKEADAVYREALSVLFRSDTAGGAYREGAADARVLIREKTVLEDLENAIDQCDSIADTLTNLAVKHG